MPERNPIPYYLIFTKSKVLNDLVDIKVKCHSGYTSDEYPICFYWDGIRFEIKEILDRWYQGDLNPEISPANYFKVKTTDGKNYILKQERKSEKWYLLVHNESINLL